MRPLSVLVVDDNADAADSTATILQYHGYEVRVAGSGEEALRAADDAPDVALLDLLMPGLNGWELARRLRGRPGPKRPLLVALTGRADDDARRQSEAVGMDLHLVKPVEPGVLVSLLERFQRVL